MDQVAAGVTVELARGDQRIIINAGFRHKEQCKQVPGSKWNADMKHWSVPTSYAACWQLGGIFGPTLVIGPRLQEWYANEVATRVEPSMALRLATDCDGDADLYPFQRAGVRWLHWSRDSILCDEMGTGKTVQTAVLLRTLQDRGEDPYPCLIVCPNSVKTVWRRELAKYNPGASVAIIAGGAVARRKALAEEADIIIVNYEMAWRMSRLKGYGAMALSDKEKESKELNAIGWRTVIADEAHKLKDPKSKQTRGVWWLAHQSSVVRRHALTGTPLANAPDDLWAILHMVAPHEWPARTQYVDRYCLYSWNPFGEMAVVGVTPEHSAEFFGIVDPRMRRMPKDLVLPFLPPKIRSVRETEMTPKQAKAYAQMEATMYAELEDRLGVEAGTVATLPIVQNTRLMQFSSSYAIVEEYRKPAPKGYTTYSEDGAWLWNGYNWEDAPPLAKRVRLEFPSNKIDELESFVDELPADEPLVVFAQSRQLIVMAGKKLESKGIACRYIMGGMSPDERENATNDFQEGRARIILLTIGAGGEGITLTRARQLVFLQRSWSMLANKQAEDRVHRIGSEIHDSVHIVDFVAPGTIEVQQIAVLHEKLNRLQEIVRDRETLRLAAEGGNQDAAVKLAALEAEEAAINAQDELAPTFAHTDLLMTDYTEDNDE